MRGLRFIGLAAIKSFAFAIAIVAVDAAVSQSHAEAKCCRPDAPDCRPDEYSGKQVALVVGVNSYSGSNPSRLGDLKNAINDAELLAKSYSRFFKVRCIIDPTKDEFAIEVDKLRTYLREINEKLGGLSLDRGTAVLHFSGHGLRLEGNDYIFLKGDFESKEDAIRRGAINLLLTARDFSGLENVDLFVTMDACRNVGSLNWAQHALDRQTLYQLGDTIAVLHSTGANQEAHDFSSDIANGKNGAFAAGVVRYFGLTIAPLEWIYRFAGVDPVMRKAKQRPTYITSHSVSLLPWSGKSTDACGDSDQTILAHYVQCLRKPDTPITAVCMRDQVCTRYNRRLTLHPSCDTNELTSTLSDLKSQCQLTASRTLQSTGDLSFATQVENALRSAQSIRDRRLTPIGMFASDSFPPISPSSSMALERQLQEIPQLAAKNRSLTAPPQPVQNLRSQILVTAALPVDQTQKNMAAWLQVPPGPIELSLLPETTAGSTGVITPIGPAKINCNQYCSKDWAYVEVPTQRGVVPGWVRTDKLRPKETISAFTMRYRDRDIRPLEDDLKQVRNMLRHAKQYEKSIVKITTVSTSNDESSILLAEARADFIELRLQSRGIQAERVSTILAVLEYGEPRLTIELFAAD
jgi:hypothetical protein